MLHTVLVIVATSKLWSSTKICLWLKAAALFLVCKAAACIVVSNSCYAFICVCGFCQNNLKIIVPGIIYYCACVLTDNSSSRHTVGPVELSDGWIEKEFFDAQRFDTHCGLCQEHVCANFFFAKVPFWGSSRKY